MPIIQPNRQNLTIRPPMMTYDDVQYSVAIIPIAFKLSFRYDSIPVWRASL